MVHQHQWLIGKSRALWEARLDRLRSFWSTGDLARVKGPYVFFHLSVDLGPPQFWTVALFALRHSCMIFMGQADGSLSELSWKYHGGTSELDVLVSDTEFFCYRFVWLREFLQLIRFEVIPNLCQFFNLLWRFVGFLQLLWLVVLVAQQDSERIYLCIFPCYFLEAWWVGETMGRPGCALQDNTLQWSHILGVLVPISQLGLEWPCLGS